MDEIFRQTVIALRGMWRHRQFGLASAWVLGALGIAAVMAIPDKYEASARVYINTESILKPLMAGMTVAPDINQRIAILSRLLVSRPNVEKLVSMPGPNAQIYTREELEKRVDELIRDLQIRGTSRDHVYTVTLRDRDPERAKRMVEQFTTLFMESGQGNRDGDTDVAKKFIDQQIAIYEKKLEEAESQLKDFKRRYLGMTPGDGKDYFTRLTEASNLSNRAQLELREAEQSRDALSHGLAVLATGDGASSSGTDPRVEIGTRIESMKRDLSVLLQKYTEAHPDIVGIRRVIQELEAQKASLPAGRWKDPAPSSAASGQLNVALAQAEATVASLRTRVAEYAARYSQLKESAMLIPQLEAEFAQLNRDYEVNKKNYESLITRRESVAISGEMQSVSGVGDFKLIDPPRVSPRPVAPNRALLLALALVISLAAGAATAYGATMLNPTFYDVRTLIDATDLPVLGTVMVIGGGGMTYDTKRSIARFVAAVGALFVVYAAGFAATALLGTSPV